MHIFINFNLANRRQRGFVLHAVSSRTRQRERGGEERTKEAEKVIRAIAAH